MRVMLACSQGHAHPVNVARFQRRAGQQAYTYGLALRLRVYVVLELAATSICIASCNRKFMIKVCTRRKAQKSKAKKRGHKKSEKKEIGKSTTNTSRDSR